MLKNSARPTRPTSRRISAMPKEITYEEALKREYHREYSRTHLTKRGRFEASFERFQAIEADESKDAYLSDGGKGAEAIRSFDETEREATKRAYDKAWHKVMRRAPECLATFSFIVKNGRNRYKSICDIILANLLLASKSKPQSSRARSGKRASSRPQSVSTTGT